MSGAINAVTTEAGELAGDVTRPIFAAPGKFIDAIKDPKAFWYWLTLSSAGQATLVGAVTFGLVAGGMHAYRSECDRKGTYWVKGVAVPFVFAAAIGSLYYCRRGGL